MFKVTYEYKDNKNKWKKCVIPETGNGLNKMEAMKVAGEIKYSNVLTRKIRIEVMK